MRRVVIAILVIASLGLAAGFAVGLATPGPPPAEATEPRVILLHGLGRSERAMVVLARRFEAAGFTSVPIGYDSRQQDLDGIVDEVSGQIARCCGQASELHFVTHSLGGIVLRAWVARDMPPRLGRVVMLSPPNHGSDLVDTLGDLAELLGPTGSELGTEPDSVPNRLNALGPVTFDLGVIAGDRSWNPIGSWLLDGPDDGTVSVESAKLAGMRDFLVLPSSHSFMMFDDEVARQAIHFVEMGRFDGGDLNGGAMESAAPSSVE